jgi:glycosyltransferase involved in cell wall biosynthesis
VHFVAVPSLVHPISPLADIRALLELVSTFRRLKPDVVHTHQSKAGIVGRVAGRIAGAKAVVHTVHIIPFTNVSRAHRFVYIWAERLAARFCDALIFVSEGAKAEYTQHAIGKGLPAIVIPSGMDIARFQNHDGSLESADARRLAHEQKHSLKLLYLSSFEDRKRHKPLVESMARNRDKLSGCHVILAGEGSTKPEIAELVKTLGLSETVSILDHCETPEDLIAISDLCLYASEREGLPRAVIQYLASGKPVVVSNLPGIGEIVRDGVNGIVTPADNLDDLVRAVVTLADDKALLERLATGARGTDTSRWQSDVMTEQVAALYRDVIAGR